MKSTVVAVLLAAGAMSSEAGSSRAVAAAASPSPAVAPTKLSASDLSRMDATARASLQGRDVIVSGFAGDLLIVNDGHDARRVLRIATSPHGAGIIAGCVAYDRDDFDHRLRGATVGASVSLEGYVAGPFDAAAATIARVAPIVIVACHFVESKHGNV